VTCAAWISGAVGPPDLAHIDDIHASWFSLRHAETMSSEFELALVNIMRNFQRQSYAVPVVTNIVVRLQGQSYCCCPQYCKYLVILMTIYNANYIVVIVTEIVR